MGGSGSLALGPAHALLRHRDGVGRRSSEADGLQISWIAAATLCVIGTGMAYTLWWGHVVQHHVWWVDPADSWGIIRGAHWVAWGGFSYIYNAKYTGVLTLPGFEILLAPFAALSSALHLSETAPGLLPNIEPNAWLLFGPIFFATTAAALFAFDALALTLQIRVQRRRLLIILEAAALWQIITFWGHPEDVLALAFLCFAVNATLTSRWTAAGWLLGAALAMQLFSLTLVPILLGLAGWRRAPSLIARAAVLPGFLFLAVVVPNPHTTLQALINQPAYPKILFPTPWLSLAPKLAHGAVAGGPARLVGFAVAIGSGVLAARRREDPWVVIWLIAAALAGRSLFESVIVPYYMVPAIAFALIVGFSSGRARMTMTVIVAGLLVHFSYLRSGAWTYWSVVTVISLALLVVAYPWRTAAIGGECDEQAEPPSADDLDFALARGDSPAVPAALGRR